MLVTALKVLKKIEEFGYQAYIVGGYVRDCVLGITSNDIDICTNATPKDLRDIFLEACLPHEAYGSITLMVGSIRFEITTFRREITYVNNRKPIEFAYIDDLKEDLLRRDFTMNTLVMNSSSEIIDLIGGMREIDLREIKTVGNSYDKLEEDSLRILRAIRFATSLNFSLNQELKSAIIDTKYLLNSLSYERKKEELEKIFTSPNVEYGVYLLIELGLDIILDIKNISSVPSFKDLVGVWAHLNVLDIYPFSRNEKDLILEVQHACNCDLFDPYTLYKCKLYASTVAAGMKGLSRKDLTKRYVELPITLRKDIAISSEDICQLLVKKPGQFLRDIWVDLEQKITRGELANDRDMLTLYIIKTYS